MTQILRDRKCLVVSLFCLMVTFTVWRYKKNSNFIQVVRIPDTNGSEVKYAMKVVDSNPLSNASTPSISSSSFSSRHESSQTSTTLTSITSSSRDGLKFLENSAVGQPKVPTIPVSNVDGQTAGSVDLTSGFYQVSDGVFIYSAFIDRRYGAATVRLIGMQDKSISNNISCIYRLPASGLDAENPKNKLVVVATSFTIYSDWPSPNLRYQAYVYVCHTPKYWFNVTNPDCVEKPNCGVKFSVLSAEGRYETEMPLTDQFYMRFSHTKVEKNLANGNSESSRNTYDNTTASSSSNQNQRERKKKRKTKDVLLCVKAVYGQPSGTKLAEWIEFNRELGVNKIVVYDVASIGDGKRVLDYYSKTSFVEVVPFHFALQMRVLTYTDPYKTKLLEGDRMMDEQTYLVALNDCFYRHLGQYKYVLVIDWDEMVIPTRPGELIVEMADRAVEQLPNAVALMLSTAWHFDKFAESPEEISAQNDAKVRNDSGRLATKEPKPAPFLHMQNHLTRTPVMKASQPKPIIIPYYSLSINWHSVTRVPTLGDNIVRSNIPVAWQRYGFVHHFRKECKHEPVECGLLLTMGQTDEIIPRYLNVLEERVGRVVRELKLNV